MFGPLTNAKMIKADVTLNTTGLSCPMPALKTKKALDILEAGKVLLMQTTDPGAKADIPSLIKRLGHELLETENSGDVMSFYIRKK